MEQATVTAQLARRVRQLRMSLGWTAQRLADECARSGFDSLTRGTIAKIESGARKSVTAEEIAALAEVLEATPTELLGWQVNTPGKPLELLPRRMRDRLRESLTGVTAVTVPQLAALARRAGGRSTPLLPVDTDAWNVFTLLSDLNADADGHPPALTFIRFLARHLDGPHRAELESLIQDAAQRLGLKLTQKPLETASPLAGADSRLHLLILVQEDSINPARFVVSYWRQDDPDEWPPDRGEVHEVPSLDELEHRVDELITAAERAWSGHSGTATLEFLLPRSLLGLPVHKWHKEHASGLPRPLFLDYPVVVRSLERMKSPHWHRVWRERWATMTADPSPERVHFCQPPDRAQRNRIDAILSSRQWTLTVLSGAPPPEPQIVAGVDELTAALRAGIPVLLWHPEAPPDALRDVVNWLAEGNGLADLPKRAQHVRLAEFTSAPVPFDINLTRDLVLLWDDPSRTVLVDQQEPSTRPR